MKKYNYKDLRIEIFNDELFNPNSTDNKYSYNKIHYRKDLEYPCSTHGIRIYQNENEINSCLVVGEGGSMGIYENSTLLDEDKLLICCCDSVFCLTLPHLESRWQAQADDATCFEIFKLEETYIVHGELLISRIDKNGDILWQCGGRDIFVSIDGKDVFEIHSDHILVSDFENTVYKMDFDGNHIEEFKI